MKYAHILMAVASEIWAMQPEKMMAIIELLATTSAAGPAGSSVDCGPAQPAAANSANAPAVRRAQGAKDAKVDPTSWPSTPRTTFHP